MTRFSVHDRPNYEPEENPAEAESRDECIATKRLHEESGLCTEDYHGRVCELPAGHAGPHTQGHWDWGPAEDSWNTCPECGGSGKRNNGPCYCTED